MNSKQGLEMEQLILILLAVALLLFIIIWYGGLGADIAALLHRLLELF